MPFSDSDQGRSFRAFWDFLMSPARQEDLSRLLAEVFALEAVRALDPDPRLLRIHFDWLEAGEVALTMDRPLFSPPFKPRIADQVLVQGDGILDDVLFEQRHVDRAELASRVRRALQVREQISLAQLLEVHPLAQGLSELLGYLTLATEDAHAVINDQSRETVAWQDRSGRGRQATLPLVIWSRTWTGADEIRAQLERLWERGRILEARLRREELFPLRLRTSRPSARDLSQRFDEVRRWIKALEAGSKDSRGFGYDIEWTEVNSRQLGRNRVPAAIVVSSEQDALALVGKRRQAGIVWRLAEATRTAFPRLESWIADHPMSLLENSECWERVLAVLSWYRVPAGPLCRIARPSPARRGGGTRGRGRRSVRTALWPPVETGADQVSRTRRAPAPGWSH